MMSILVYKEFLICYTRYNRKRVLFLEIIIIWFFEKERWLIIIGIILAVLGACYNAYGLDTERRFFGGLTQGLSFGLVGAFFVGLGLGLVGVLLTMMLHLLYFLQEHVHPLAFYPTIFHSISFNKDLSIIGSFTVVGIILGIMGGCLIGFLSSKSGERFFAPMNVLFINLVFIEIILTTLLA